MMSQSLKQKSTLGQLNVGSHNMTYGAYGIAKNNKMSESGR